MTISAEPLASLAAPGALDFGEQSTAASSGPAKTPASPEGQKLRKAAGEFEAMLLQSLWKSMRTTFSDGDDDDPTLEGFNDLGIESMALSVGQAGGFGIKNMIVKSLEHGGATP